MSASASVFDRVSTVDTAYADRLRAEMAALWRQVLLHRAPHIVGWFDAETPVAIPANRHAVPYMQALTIWFQRSVSSKKTPQFATGTKR